MQRRAPPRIGVMQLCPGVHEEQHRVRVPPVTGVRQGCQAQVVSQPQAHSEVQKQLNGLVLALTGGRVERCEQTTNR